MLRAAVAGMRTLGVRTADSPPAPPSGALSSQGLGRVECPSAGPSPRTLRPQSRTRGLPSPHHVRAVHARAHAFTHVCTHSSLCTIHFYQLGSHVSDALTESSTRDGSALSLSEIKADDQLVNLQVQLGSLGSDFGDRKSDLVAGFECGG